MWSSEEEFNPTDILTKSKELFLSEDATREIPNMGGRFGELSLLRDRGGNGGCETTCDDVVLGLKGFLKLLLLSTTGTKVNAAGLQLLEELLLSEG
ncbi:hypothetical protein Tco_0305891 [Tanacetum coccineum]